MTDPITPAPSVRHALAELGTALAADTRLALAAWARAWRIAPAAHAASLAAGAVLLAVALAAHVVLAAPAPTADRPLPCPVGTVAQDVAGVLTCVAEADAMTATPEAAAPVPLPTPEAELPAWLPPEAEPYRAAVVAAANRYGIAPALLASVVTAESRWRPPAVSSAGAVGISQVMPATATMIAPGCGVPYDGPQDLYSPELSLALGACYLRDQLRAFGVANDPDWRQSVERAAAAYNGGPGVAKRWIAGGTLPAETVRYVRRVGCLWRERADATALPRCMV